ncbi:MAG: hypothetical protein AAGE52_16360 [Myxococcota bacterium]
MKRLSLILVVATPAFALAQDPAPEQAPEGGVVFVEHESVPPAGPDHPPPLDPNAPQQPQYAQPQFQPQYAQPRPRRVRERYDPNREYPADAQISRRVRFGLLIPGAALLVVPYAITVATWSTLRDARDDDDQPQNVLLVPVLGPFIAIAGLEDRANPGLARAGLIWDGLLQTAGVAMFVAGVIPRKYVTYYADTSRRGYALTPRIGAGGAGLDLQMRF